MNLLIGCRDSWPEPGLVTRAALSVVLIGILWCGLGRVVRAQVNVPTYHNDNARTGQNLKETILTPSNVNASGFGKLFSQPVDGYVYAQPLYLSSITIQGKGVHNVVFIATEHDSVYAFDADDDLGPNADPLWHASFLNPTAGITSVPNADVGSGDLVPEIGITGTPVIDVDSGTLYVVAKTREAVSSGFNYVQRLHALDIHSGADKPGSPVVIQASVRGIGDGNDGMGSVPFDPLRHNQRPALLLLDGVVYIGWASHGDQIPYHGWLIGYRYDGTRFTQTGMYNSTPNGLTDPSGYPLGAGGIWMAGAGPAADSNGHIFLETGNGTFDANSGGPDYGDSFVKLNTNGGLSVADYYTPSNQDTLNRTDEDLGSGGVILLPDSVGSLAHPHLIVGSGKEGTIYVVDRDNLGQYSSFSDNIVQLLAGAIGGTWSSPAYFNNTVYYNGVGDALKAFSIVNGRLSSGPKSVAAATFGYPGATPSISANGADNGIVWTLQSDGYGNSSPSILHAYDAANVARELYNSAQAGVRDALGGAVKFTVPTVANGKVYAGAQYEVDILGTGKFIASPTIAPDGGDFASPVSVTISDTTPGVQIYYTTNGSSPTQSSTLYTGAFTLAAGCTMVEASAFKAGYVPSAVTSATFMVGVPFGDGDGLWATYFSNIDLTGSTYSRTDATVDFDWNGGSPAPGIPAVNWSARWTGQVQPRCSGVYTFYTVSDDGVRLWVNDQLVIDDWTYHAPTEDRGTITLTAGQKYAIKMEYFQGGGGSVAQLFYSSPGEARQIIPQSQLYSNHVPGTPKSIALAPNPASANSYSLGILTLNDAPPDGALVTLTSTNSGVAKPLGETLWMPPGMTRRAFTVQTGDVTRNTDATISATYAGVTASTVITVKAPILVGFSIIPAVVKGGRMVRGAITITGPASANGTIVNLKSSSPDLIQVSTVTVPPGRTTVYFDIRAGAGGVLKTVTLTATLNGTSRTASVTVVP